MNRLLTVFAAVALGLAAAAIDESALAQTYPARSITMVVPFSAGGPTDVLGRILGQRMSQSLGQQIIVENVTGAGGTLGAAPAAAARAARAAPAGCARVMGTLGPHSAGGAPVFDDDLLAQRLDHALAE